MLLCGSVRTSLNTLFTRVNEASATKAFKRIFSHLMYFLQMKNAKLLWIVHIPENLQCWDHLAKFQRFRRKEMKMNSWKIFQTITEKNVARLQIIPNINHYWHERSKFQIVFAGFEHDISKRQRTCGLQVLFYTLNSVYAVFWFQEFSRTPRSAYVHRGYCYAIYRS